MISRIFFKKTSIKQLSNINTRYLISTKLKKSNDFHMPNIHKIDLKYFSNQNLSSLDKNENQKQKVSTSTELEELLQDFRSSDSKNFNKIKALETIQKYEIFLKKSNQTEKQFKLLFQEDVNIFSTKIIENIKIFEDSVDLAKILDFLIQSLPNDGFLVEKLIQNLENKDLLSIDYENLKRIVYIFGIKATLSSKVSKFNEHMKSLFKTAISKSAPKDSIRLLDLLNRVVSGSNYSTYGGKHEEINEILRNNYLAYSNEWNGYEINELALLHQFYFDSNDEKCVKFLSNIEEKLIKNINIISNKSLVLLIYNMCHTNLVNVEYWSILEKQLVSRIGNSTPDFHPSELAAIITSFASVDQGSAQLYKEIDRSIGINIKNLNYNDAPFLAWTYAISGNYQEKFFHLLKEVIVENFDNYSITDLSMVIIAYSSVSKLDQTLFTRLQTKFFENIDKLNYQDIDNIWNSLLLRKADESFFVASEDKVLELLKIPEVASYAYFLVTLFEGFICYNSSLKKLGLSLGELMIEKLENLDENILEQLFLFKIGQLVADNINCFVDQKDFLQVLKSKIEVSKQLCKDDKDDKERKIALQYFLVQIESVI